MLGVVMRMIICWALYYPGRGPLYSSLHYA